MLASLGFPPNSFINSPYTRDARTRYPSPIIIGVPKSEKVVTKTNKAPVDIEGITKGKIKDPSGKKRKDFRGPKPAKAEGGRIRKVDGGEVSDRQITKRKESIFKKRPLVMMPKLVFLSMPVIPLI